MPLTGPAIEILRNLPHKDDQLVFPSTAKGKPLSSPTFTRLLERYGIPGKPHGVRSTFAGWAADRGTPLEVIDASLAHHVGTAVTRAYVRGDFLPARRELLATWAAYCMAQTNLVALFRGDTHEQLAQDTQPKTHDQNRAGRVPT